MSKSISKAQEYADKMNQTAIDLEDLREDQPQFRAAGYHLGSVVNRGPKRKATLQIHSCEVDSNAAVAFANWLLEMYGQPSND